MKRGVIELFKTLFSACLVVQGWFLGLGLGLSTGYRLKRHLGRLNVIMISALLLFPGCAKTVRIPQPPATEIRMAIESVMTAPNISEEKKVEMVKIIMDKTEIMYKEALMRASEGGRNIREIIYQLLAAGLAIVGVVKK